MARIHQQEVICHRGLQFSKVSELKPSEIGLIPLLRDEMTVSLLSIPITENPASKKLIAVGRPTKPNPTMPIVKSRDCILDISGNVESMPFKINPSQQGL